MPGQHTLDETESQVATRLAGMDLDFEAMAVTANTRPPLVRSDPSAASDVPA